MAEEIIATAAEELLSFLLSCWEITSASAPRVEVIGENSRLFRLTTTAGKSYFLKQVGCIEKQDERRQAKVQAEYDMLRHLDARGVPVALPVLTLAGLPYARAGVHFYSLAPGLVYDHADISSGSSLEVFYNFGVAASRLHQALYSYPGEFHSWTINLYERTFAEAVPVLLSHLDEPEQARFKSALKSIETPCRAIFSDLPTQHIHGDLHGGNVLFNGEQVSGFIDLDHLPCGPRVYDLGYFLADWVKNRHHNPDEIEPLFVAIPSLLRGYQQVTPLEGRENKALVYTMLATQLIFAAWFFEPLKQAERARFNLDAFYWIFANKDRIAARADDGING